MAPLLGNSRRRIELINGLLFSLPGTPVIYYGDEIGMGDNMFLGDRNGVRTPMQWSSDRNAGFSRCNPQRLYLPVIIDPEYHYESINVEAQQNNQNSLLWWTKRLIGLRRRYRAFSRGTLEFLRPLNRHIFAFLRKHEDETVLVVANLSRFVQYVELDLASYEGTVPVEMFGGAPFPAVGSRPYLLTLGPHSFYWFLLSPATVGETSATIQPSELPAVILRSPWRELTAEAFNERFENALACYLQRTFFRRAREIPIRRASVRDLISVSFDDTMTHLVLLNVETPASETEHAWLAIAMVGDETVNAWSTAERQNLIAKATGLESGWLCDATVFTEFNSTLMNIIRHSNRMPTARGGMLCGEHSSIEWDEPDSAAQQPSVWRPIESQASTRLCSQSIAGLKAARSTAVDRSSGTRIGAMAVGVLRIHRSRSLARGDRIA